MNLYFLRQKGIGKKEHQTTNQANVQPQKPCIFKEVMSEVSWNLSPLMSLFFLSAAAFGEQNKREECLTHTKKRKKKWIVKFVRVSDLPCHTLRNKFFEHFIWSGIGRKIPTGCHPPQRRMYNTHQVDLCDFFEESFCQDWKG